MKLSINLLSVIALFLCSQACGAAHQQQMDPFLIAQGRIKKKEITAALCTPSITVNETLNQLVAHSIGQWITIIEKCEQHLPAKAAYDHAITMLTAPRQQSSSQSTSSATNTSNPKK